jgi:hypothetical protein
MVLLCLASFKSLLAIVALAALALISPFVFIGLLVILAAIFILTK